MSERIPAIERFWKKVEKRESGCWEWVGAKSPEGYGNMRCGPENKPKGVHRFAYEELVGPIPEGHQIDHLCENRSCVNPAHLEPVIGYVNNERGKRARQTHCKRGHPLSGDNLYMAEGRRRVCRACQALAQQEWRSGNREKSLAATNRWREKNVEKYRAYAREYQRKKRAAKKAQEAEPSP